MLEYFNGLVLWQKILVIVILAIAVFSLIVYIYERVQYSKRRKPQQVDFTIRSYEGDVLKLDYTSKAKLSKTDNVKANGVILPYVLSEQSLEIKLHEIENDKLQIDFCLKNGLVFARGILLNVEASKAKSAEVTPEEQRQIINNILLQVNEEPKEEVVEEDVPEVENDEDEIVEEVVDGKTVFVLYKKSFLAKLSQASADTKSYYVELANYMMNYKKVHQRYSFSCSTFNFGRNKLVKITLRGKTMSMYLALDPAEYVDSKYFGVDVSHIKKYEDVPLKIKVKSDRGVKFAKELFDKLVEKFNLEKANEEIEYMSVKDYPYKSKEKLLEEGLIKKSIVEREVKNDGTQTLTSTIVPQEDKETQATINSSVEEDGDENEIVEEVVDGKTVLVIYKKSFLAKLSLSSPEIKSYYVELVNALMQYKKVHSRDSSSGTTFNYGRDKICKLTIRGKTLSMYLALNPTDYSDSRYFGVDVSHIKKYEDVPLKIKVKSDRGVRHAKELLEKLVEKYELVLDKNNTPYTSIDNYPTKSKENLVEEGLIKKIVVES